MHVFDINDNTTDDNESTEISVDSSQSILNRNFSDGQQKSRNITLTLVTFSLTIAYFVLFYIMTIFWKGVLEEPLALISLLNATHWFIDVVILIILFGINDEQALFRIYLFLFIIDLLNTIIRLAIIFACLFGKDDFMIFSIQFCDSLLKQFAFLIITSLILFFTLVNLTIAFSNKTLQKIDKNKEQILREVSYFKNKVD